jgi:hypothetical protein
MRQVKTMFAEERGPGKRRARRKIDDRSQRGSGKKNDSGFIIYPLNKVVGIIDRVRDVKAALDDLRVAGFPANKIEVLSGEEGAERIDAAGVKHGGLARAVRSTQKALGSYEIEDATRHESEFKAGHFGIGVSAPRKAEREKVRQIPKAHRGHFINFYGRWAMERLEP